jgi:hypothetical protein
MWMMATAYAAMRTDELTHLWYGSCPRMRVEIFRGAFWCEPSAGEVEEST